MLCNDSVEDADVSSCLLLQAMAAMDRWSTWLDEAEFVPPASFYSDPESDYDST